MSTRILDSCPVDAGHCLNILFDELQLYMIFINACYFILKKKKRNLKMWMAYFYEYIRNFAFTTNNETHRQQMIHMLFVIFRRN